MILSIVISFLNIYTFVLLGRAIFSWFQLSPDSPLAPLRSFLWQVTEPVLEPVRSVMPRTGMFDLSFLLVFIAIRILIQVLRNLA